MARRPTIIDVANCAGVSKSTVSLVLKESPLVREETRAQVRQAMNELGYVYNRAAANLRSTNAGLIGLVINDLRNPFFTEFATSAQMALSGRGYATVVANTDEDPGLQAQVVGSMIEHGISALVISPTYGAEEDTFGPLARAGIPVLQVLRQVDPSERFPFASLDYARGGRLAAEHLLNLGARRIAFAGGVEGRPITLERMAGYLDVMRERGQEPLLLAGRSSRAFGRDTAVALSEDRPEVDAVICFNDLVGLGMLSGFLSVGRRVGRDIRIVGFDDIEECIMAYPPLSSVRCDIAGFGRGTAATLLDWLEEGRRPPPESRAPVSLVARASSLGA
ncbi:LacI family DNA-binding transcriptional regulator [Rubellimicrobium roseum]|uniref:LacI family DNA-binding transcriptional regulator n=1 Tax=Rubellimicrobium roseum TaxID=687525 RepID=A0A5C4NKS4_9RHOB|nr:LacI family DNA-binding transcriptional regulator [Rubellimicrobium roseum]TNC74722.1 LacI family DNA-binding transcriptional regulator [Rubellimicrobium roseum]